MVTRPKGLGPKKDYAGKGQQHIQKTDPPSRQRERLTSTSLQLSESNKDLVLSPRWVLCSKTDWLTARRLLYNFDFDFDQKSVAEREQKWDESKAVKEEGFG
jgi:hypothetical protein